MGHVFCSGKTMPLDVLDHLSEHCNDGNEWLFTLIFERSFSDNYVEIFGVKILLGQLSNRKMSFRDI